MVRLARVVSIGLALAALAGCIGATTRSDFEDEVRARGGGLTAGALTAPLDVVAVEVGGTTWTELSVLSLTARPGDRTVTVIARRLDRADFVDTVTVRDGEIVGVAPVQDAADLPLDDLAIPLDAVALDRIDEIRAEALAAFGDEGAFVDAVTLTRRGPEVTIGVEVESSRRTATVLFDADGTLRGIA